MSDDDMRIVPERDEIRPRTNVTRTNVKSTTVKSKTAKKTAPSVAADPKSRSKPAPAPARSGSSAMTWVLCVLVVALSGAAAYLYLQIQDLSEQRDALAERVLDIESKLSVTDESLSQSGAVIQTVLKEHAKNLDLHFSEIDKLWAVSNKRNKNWIDELKRDQKNTNSRIDSLAGSVARVDPILEGYDGILSRLETMSSQLLVQSATVDDLASQTRVLADDSARTSSKLNSQSSAIEQHQEAIDAIDQYRIQNNQRLLRLEQSLAPAPATPAGT